MSDSEARVVDPVAPAPSVDTVAPPVTRAVWAPAARSERIVNLVLAAVAMTVLAVAFALEPAAAGHGTHEQLGLPKCNFLVVTGLPCLSCGMTTSFAHTVRGQWISGFLVQPFGFLLAIATLCSVVPLLWSAARGRSLAIPLSRWNWRLWGPLLLAALLGAWIYKIVVIRAGA